MNQKTNENIFHCWYIEPRNREKSLTLIWQRFSCLLDEWIAKISKKNFFSRWLFKIIHIIRFEMPMDSQIKSWMDSNLYPISNQQGAFHLKSCVEKSVLIKIDWTANQPRYWFELLRRYTGFTPIIGVKPVYHSNRHY